MRVSSPMMPFLIGTLKSTRMNTRLPWSGTSLIESFAMRNISEQDAVLHHHRERRQRAIGLVEAAAGFPIELPAVQRTLEAGALVVDAAALVRTDIGQQGKPFAAPHQKVGPQPF